MTLLSALAKDRSEGIRDYVAGETSLSYAFDRYMALKYDLKPSTKANYEYTSFQVRKRGFECYLLLAAMAVAPIPNSRKIGSALTASPSTATMSAPTMTKPIRLNTAPRTAPQILKNRPISLKTRTIKRIANRILMRSPPGSNAKYFFLQLKTGYNECGQTDRAKCEKYRMVFLQNLGNKRS